MSIKQQATVKRARRKRKTLYPEYYQVRMTKAHRQMLDALSDEWNTTPAEVLRRLIYERYSQEVERGGLRTVFTLEPVEDGKFIGKKQLALGLDAEN